MTQLELVEHKKTMDFKSGEKGIIRNVVAVSSSYSALVEYCKDELGSEIDDIGRTKKYYTIHKSDIAIIPSKY